MDGGAAVRGVAKSQIPLSTHHTHIIVKSFVLFFSEFLPDSFQMPKNTMYLLAQKSHFCNYRYFGVYVKETEL